MTGLVISKDDAEKVLALNVSAVYSCLRDAAGCGHNPSRKGKTTNGKNIAPVNSKSAYARKPGYSMLVNIPS